MLHSNDSGYVHFYNDVVTELEALKSDFDITEQGSIMIEAYELIAEEYIEFGAEYGWGGQDPLPRTIVVDCSGLVIRCYQYACEEFGYRLLFNDTTSYGLLNYTIPLSQNTLTPGDLLFMGNGDISHVALFVGNDGTNITFVDSTYKPEEGIYGVSERYYAKDDPRFISYGRMICRH